MKPITLSFLCIGLLTLSVHAKECELIITPSDFQLDNQLKAPNESLEFSAAGNLFYIGNMQGYTKAFFCAGLTNRNLDTTRACIADLDHLFEKNPDKITNTSTTVDVITYNNKYGFKISGSSPISKKDICTIQNKYKTKTSWSRAEILPFLEKKQEQIREAYLEASKSIGQLKDPDKITETILFIENKR